MQPHTARHGGHLFVSIDQKGVLQSPDRIHPTALSPRHVDPAQVSARFGEPSHLSARPGETAYVLARRPDETWRYLGVARPIDGGPEWQLPSVDYETWCTWGEGREVSQDP